MSKTIITLVVILLVGLVLRVAKLDARPLGFTWDEAALGYNAYSLLLTGRDEYRTKIPIVLKSFGDYKPGLYAYLAVVPISILGLSEFATRIPSALFGTLLIAGIFLLAAKLFSPRVGLWSALLLAINPWALHFSRGSWEANVSLTLLVLATVLFLSRRYLLSFLLFGLTLWTYQGAKLFMPLLIMALFVIYRPNIKKLLFPGLLLFALSWPIIINLSIQSGRLNVLSVFNYTRPQPVIERILAQDSLTQPTALFKIFHAEIIDQTKGVFQRFLNHLSPRFLFIEGDWSNLRHQTPYYGNFHLAEIITIILGFVVLIRSKSKPALLVAFWVVFAILPASLSRDIVTAVRSLPLVIPLTLISALGLSALSKRKLLLIIYSPLLIFSLFYYLDLYYVHSPHFTAEAWLYPYKKAIALLNNNIANYDHVKFTSKLGQPYIFILFYNQVHPTRYQPWAKLAASDSGDVGEVKSWDKYTFGPIFWPAERGSTSTIFIGDQYELPDQDLNPANLVRLGEIEYPNGSHALRLVGLK